MADKDTLIKNLAQFIQQNPKDINAWLSLARLIDDQKKKVDCYKRVLQLDPENLEAEEYFLRMTREKNISRSESISPLFPETVQPLKSKKSTKNMGLIWIGISLICFLSIIATYLVLGLISQSKNNLQSFQVESPIPPKLYNQNPKNYLPNIAEMPNGFEILYEMDESGTLRYDTKLKETGTFATRTYSNPTAETNKITTVLFFILVYGDLDEAKNGYQDTKQLMVAPKPITGNFDEGAYEVGVFDTTTNVIYLDQSLRKSNVVISMRCLAVLDSNTDPEMLAMWALYYHNLILSKFE